MTEKKKKVSKKKVTGKEQTPKMTSRDKILKYCKSEAIGKGEFMIFGKHKYRMHKTLTNHSDAECNKVLKNLMEFGLGAHIKQIEKTKIVASKRKTVTTTDPKPCECGCGAITRRGSKFLPGHDMKLKSALRKAGTPKAKKELTSRGWA